MHWTEYDKKFVRDNAGTMPADKMGIELNKSGRSVRAYAARNGIDVTIKRNHSKGVIDKAKELIVLLKSNRDISEETGLSMDYVRKLRASMNETKAVPKSDFSAEINNVFR